jgi:hypothetical protein
MVAQPSHNPFRQRVEQAAEAVLKRAGSVGPLELLQEMRLLQPAHIKAWRQVLETYRVLQPWIQVGPSKFDQTIYYFRA